MGFATAYLPDNDARVFVLASQHADIASLFVVSKDLHPTYFNHERTHSAIEGDTPVGGRENLTANIVSLDNYRWQKHCNGLFELPIAA